MNQRSKRLKLTYDRDQMQSGFSKGKSLMSHDVSTADPGGTVLLCYCQFKVQSIILIVRQIQ